MPRYTCSDTRLRQAGGHVHDDLLRRIHVAAARAADLAREAELQARTSAAIRSRGLTARCAWCGRYRVGDEWLGADDVPAFPPSTGVTTHSICPGCWDELHSARLSVEQPGSAAARSSGRR
jgi:hypothetical protein